MTMPLATSLPRFVLACCAVAAFVMASPTSSRAQAPDKPIKIGVLTDFGGVYRDVGGQGSVVAAKLAAEEFGGKIGNRPIEVISADGQNKPDVSSSIARQWFDQEGVDIIVDLPASTVAIAAQDVARDRKKITVTTGGGTTELTGADCSPTGFHWSWDTYAMSYGTAKAIEKAGGKSWFFITGDFAAAKALQTGATKAILEAGGSVLGTALVPFQTVDFSSQMLDAQQSGAQVVAMANAGQDVINAIKQSAEFGLPPKQQIVGLIIYITDVNSLGLKATAGMRFMTGFYWDATPESRAWSQKFGARMNGAMPTMSQAGVYSSVRHFLQAVKDTGTDDGPTVAAKMKATPVNDMFTHDGHLREDGLMVHDMRLVEVKIPAESKGPWDYYKTIAIVPGDEAFLSLAQGGCPLVKK
jgi:branched-chain amino acid transport system substrate-binding protein